MDQNLLNKKIFKKRNVDAQDRSWDQSGDFQHIRLTHINWKINLILNLNYIKITDYNSRQLKILLIILISSRLL